MTIFLVFFWFYFADRFYIGIIFEYVDTIVDQGFDGIYCDIIDAYYYWSDENPVEPDAARLMIEFLSNINDHVGKDDFLIFPQNGEFVAYEDGIDDNVRELYFQTISAIGVEDVFCLGDLEEDNPFSPDDVRLEILNEYLSQGKKVFSVEYLTDESIKEQFLTAASDNGFIPYITKRNLGILHDGILTGINNEDPNIVTKFELFQNYPNPFNPSTTIKYSIPVNSMQYAVCSMQHPELSIQNQVSVSLKVYDVLGKEVETLVNQEQRPGNYEVKWDATGHASGLYFYKLSTNDYTILKKMILLR